MTKIKTIDVQAKEWWDKVNGNSYFAGIITVNYGMKDERQYKVPYQYGYGSTYEDEAKKLLIEFNQIDANWSTPLWKYCKENGIILRSWKKEKCKKSELKNI
jgi:hypothetical protein